MTPHVALTRRVRLVKDGALAAVGFAIHSKGGTLILTARLHVWVGLLRRARWASLPVVVRRWLSWILDWSRKWETASPGFQETPY
jgi:hypothetical protein